MPTDKTEDKDKQDLFDVLLDDINSSKANNQDRDNANNSLEDSFDEILKENKKNEDSVEDTFDMGFDVDQMWNESNYTKKKVSQEVPNIVSESNIEEQTSQEVNSEEAKVYQAQKELVQDVNTQNEYIREVEVQPTQDEYVQKVEVQPKQDEYVQEPYIAPQPTYGYENRQYNFIAETESDIYITDDSSVYRRKDNRDNAKGMKLLFGAIILLIVCGGLAYFFISRRAIVDRFEAALYNNNYDKALELYDDVPNNSKSKADEFILDKIQNIFDRYSKGHIKSDEAIKELNYLGRIQSGAKDMISEGIVEFNKIVTSESFFQKAQEYYEQDDYENAIINYYSVIEKDCNYDQAQKMMKKSVDAYKDKEIQKAEEYIAQEDYDNAIAVMKECQELLQSDTEVREKYSEYISLKLAVYIEDILVAAEECAVENDFVGAVKVMYEAITEYGQDEQLTTKLDEYKTSLVDEINENIQNKKYNRAVGLVDDYLLVVGEDEEVAALIMDYRQFADSGIAINDITFKSTEGKYYASDDNNVYTDCDGNVFNKAIELIGYKNLDDKGSIVIENNNYAKIKGTIGYSTYEYFTNGEGKLVIKADDKEIFSQKNIKESMKDIDIDVEVPECEEITIEWSKDSGSKQAYGIVIGDFRFIATSDNITDEQ